MRAQQLALNYCKHRRNRWCAALGWAVVALPTKHNQNSDEKGRKTSCCGKEAIQEKTQHFSLVVWAICVSFIAAAQEAIQPMAAHMDDVVRTQTSSNDDLGALSRELALIDQQIRTLQAARVQVVQKMDEASPIGVMPVLDWLEESGWKPDHHPLSPASYRRAFSKRDQSVLTAAASPPEALTTRGELDDHVPLSSDSFRRARAAHGAVQRMAVPPSTGDDTHRPLSRDSFRRRLNDGRASAPESFSPITPVNTDMDMEAHRPLSSDSFRRALHRTAEPMSMIVAH